MSRPSSRGERTPQHRSRSSSRLSTYSNGPNGAHTPAPDPDDFCNSFWGDNGYVALLARVKASSRMLEDLRTWYKERAAVEDEYAKKLARLAKAPVLAASYEMGGLKMALETVRVATAQSAHSHNELAGTIRTALEARVAEFVVRRDGLRKNPQALIEKLFKKKNDLAEVTEKSRKKYEADAIAVNGFTAQTHLVQGRDLDKVSTRLDKAKDSVLINEKEYRAYMKNIKDTTAEWQMQWKAFCDLAQDLEEDRTDFIRTSFWDYANGVSTICVVDDEQCEKVRTSLEQCQTVRDIKQFVRQAGTGNEIYEAPDYVNYARGEQLPSKPTIAIANFVRSSTRNPKAVTETTSIQDLAEAIRSGPPSPPREPSPPPPTARQNKVTTKRGGAIADAVAANAFAGNRSSLDPPGSSAPSNPLKRASSPAEAMMNAIGRSPSPANSVSSVNNRGPPSVRGAYVPPRGTGASPAPVTSSLPPPPGAPGAPTAVKPNRYSGQGYATSPSTGVGGGFGEPSAPSEVSVRSRPSQPSAPLLAPEPPEKRPAQRSASPAPNDFALQPPSLPGQDGNVDPLVAALERLRSTPSIGSMRSPRSPAAVRAKSPAPMQQGSRPGMMNTDSRPDVGSWRKDSISVPQQHGASVRSSSPAPRAPSPQPPQPAYNQRPSQQQQQAPQQVTKSGPNPQVAYRPPPGRSQSQYSGSLASPATDAPPRSASPLGLDGSGSRSRGARLGQMMSPSANAGPPSNQPQPGQQTQAMPPRQPSPAPMQQQPNPMYQFTPYQSSPAHLQQHVSPPPAQQPQMSMAQPTYGAGGYGVVPTQPPYGNNVAPQLQQTQQQPPQQVPQQPAYMNQYQNPYQAQPPPPPPQQQQQQQQPPPAQTPAPGNYYHGQMRQMSSDLSRAGGGGVMVPPIQQQPPQQQQAPYYQQQQQQQRAPSPQPPPQQQQPRQVNGVPPPTGSYTDRGEPILFYVRAMYAYSATTPEDFSFQADDIIAITATNPDGWWQGELLDERRRGMGGNTLPSNFVDLLP